MTNRLLRLAVFDLDFTVWQPEMYQLIGGPKLVAAEKLGLSTHELLEAQTSEEGKILVDEE